jgi:Asp-tRNA(Asn)/Glu-tRNA(Gln) amidotransferase B subunit
VDRFGPADDYRYFPEPDLLPIGPPAALVASLRAALPKAPAVLRRRDHRGRDEGDQLRKRAA